MERLFHSTNYYRTLCLHVIIYYTPSLKILISDMCRELTSLGSLVERTVEGGNEEHHHLGTHAEEQHEIGTRQVGKLE